MSRLCKRLGDFKPGYYSERSGHSTSPLQSLSVISAGRSGGSIKRNEGDRKRKRKTPEKGGRRNGKNWNGSRGNAGKQPLPALPGTGFPC